MAKKGLKGKMIAPEDEPVLVVVGLVADGDVVVVVVEGGDPESVAGVVEPEEEGEEALTVTASFMPPEQWPTALQMK